MKKWSYLVLLILFIPFVSAQNATVKGIVLDSLDNLVGYADVKLDCTGQIIRTDKFGTVHSPVGKISFEEKQLSENIRSLVATLMRMKPAVSKGDYFKSMTLSSSMGPGIKVEKTSAGAK